MGKTLTCDGNLEEEPLRLRTETLKYGSASRLSRMEGPRLPPA